MASYIFSSSILSSIILILRESHICVCTCVCVYSHTRVYSSIFGILYITQKWCELICMRRTPMQGWGRRLLPGETTTVFDLWLPCLHLGVSVYNPSLSTPKMECEFVRKPALAYVCVRQMLYNPGSTAKTLLCLQNKNIYLQKKTFWSKHWTVCQIYWSMKEKVLVKLPRES